MTVTSSPFIKSCVETQNKKLSGVTVAGDRMCFCVMMFHFSVELLIFVRLHTETEQTEVWTSNTRQLKLHLIVFEETRCDKNKTVLWRKAALQSEVWRFGSNEMWNKWFWQKREMFFLQLMILSHRGVWLIYSGRRLVRPASGLFCFTLTHTDVTRCKFMDFIYLCWCRLLTLSVLLVRLQSDRLSLTFVPSVSSLSTRRPAVCWLFTTARSRITRRCVSSGRTPVRVPEPPASGTARWRPSCLTWCTHTSPSPRCRSATQPSTFVLYKTPSLQRDWRLSSLSLQGEDIVFLATDINLPGAVDWVMMQSCFSHHFMLVLEKQEKYEGHQQFFAVVLLIGTRKQAENFAYRLELNGNRRRLTWEATPRSIHDGVAAAIMNSDCLVFDTSIAHLFADNGNLGINVTISMCWGSTHHNRDTCRTSSGGVGFTFGLGPWSWWYRRLSSWSRLWGTNRTLGDVLNAERKLLKWLASSDRAAAAPWWIMGRPSVPWLDAGGQVEEISTSDEHRASVALESSDRAVLIFFSRAETNRFFRLYMFTVFCCGASVSGSSPQRSPAQQVRTNRHCSGFHLSCMSKVPPT